MFTRFRSFACPLLAVMVLSGCSSLMTRTPEELRQSQDDAFRVCTQLAVEEAAERVRAGWRGCHYTGPTPSMTQAAVTGSVPVMVQSGPYAGDFIRVDRKGQQLTVVKGADSSKLGVVIQLMADVVETQSCKAEVLARGSGPVWNSRARGVAHYLAHPEAGCEPK